MAGHLADKGRKILLNGYNVIPIAPGGKFPTIKKWQNIKTTPELIGRWLRNGHAKDGIGITTGEVSFVDLDTPDPDAAQFMRDWVETNIGFAPIRVGNAPKHGLLFRSPNPFRKIASKTYVDDRGHDTRVEILGIGQQFVSHHIHPDTHRPYRWTAGDNPEHTRVEDLPPITEEQARSICDELDAYAASRGWKVKSGLTATNSLAVTDHSKALAGLQNEPEWNKVISALRSFPVDSRDDREKWYRVGMIL